MHAVLLKVCVEMHFIMFDICKHIYCNDNRSIYIVMIIDCICLRHKNSVPFCSVSYAWMAKV